MSRRQQESFSPEVTVLTDKMMQAYSAQQLERAFKFGQQASELGCWIADFNLAEWYFVGCGKLVPRPDYAASWRHYERAALALADATPAGVVWPSLYGHVPRTLTNWIGLFLARQVPRQMLTDSEPLMRRWATGKVSVKIPKEYLRACRIAATYALAHWHYDAGERDTAAACYRQLIDSYTKFTPVELKTFDFLHNVYQQSRSNLLRMHAHDPETLRRLLEEGGPDLLEAFEYDPQDIPAPTPEEVARRLPGQVLTSNVAAKSYCIPDGPLPLLTCGQCGKEAMQLLRCARCKQARYCNSTCQKAHWPQHKKTCCQAD